MVSTSRPASSSSSLIRLAALLITALLSLVVFAGSAKACSYSGAEKVFSPWGDQRNYVLAPDGGFEAGGSGWELNRGAVVVDGNESHYLNDPGDSKSLSLPAASSAVSPPICMALDTPSFRLVARNSGNPSSQLRVEAVYKLLGLIRTRTAGTLRAGPAWAPTQSISTVLTLSTVVGTLIPSAIAIRVVPLDASGRWQIDDLYIDPFRRG
ncbi:MAG TPA: hypothetical protein VG458_01250 [Solirubrobacterales bacterium]|nr:hypothetical protein [Solirubrobacterales bacterium]